jgi:hypothetical protein
VNAKAADDYFNGKKQEGILSFRKNLVYDLINNSHLT